MCTDMVPAVTPRCIAVSKAGLVAIGGVFNGVGNVAATNIVVWRRDHWAALEQGFYSADQEPNSVVPFRAPAAYALGNYGPKLLVESKCLPRQLFEF